MNTLAGVLIPYVAIMTFTGLVIGLIRLILDVLKRLDESLSESARERLRQHVSPDKMLRLSKATDSVLIFPTNISKWFDAFFGSNLIGWNAFKRSCIVSGSVVSFVFLVMFIVIFATQKLVTGENAFLKLTYDGLKSIALVAVVPMALLYLTNCVVDTVAIIKTRLLMRSLIGCRSIFILVAALVIDVATTLVIYLSGTATSIFIILSVVGYMLVFPLVWAMIAVSAIEPVSFQLMLKTLYACAIAMPLSACANILDPSVLMATVGMYSEPVFSINFNDWAPFEIPFNVLHIEQGYIGRGSLLTPFFYSTFLISGLTAVYFFLRCAALSLLGVLSVFRFFLTFIDFSKSPFFLIFIVAFVVFFLFSISMLFFV